MIKASFGYQENYFIQLKKRIDKRLNDRINKAMTMIANIFMEECKRLTPEDTKEMLNSYKISEIKREGDAYTVIISNTAKHAIYVEYGIRGLTYNYHKPKGSVFYSGVGNRTMARAMDNKRDEMLKVLQSMLG